MKVNILFLGLLVVQVVAAMQNDERDNCHQFKRLKIENSKTQQNNNVVYVDRNSVKNDDFREDNKKIVIYDLKQGTENYKLNTLRHDEKNLSDSSIDNNIPGSCIVFLKKECVMPTPIGLSFDKFSDGLKKVLALSLKLSNAFMEMDIIPLDDSEDMMNTKSMNIFENKNTCKEYDYVEIGEGLSEKNCLKYLKDNNINIKNTL